MLAAHGTPEQKEKYLIHYIEGKTVSAMCISEPGAGGDPGMMTSKAEPDGDDWVLNGRKIWISRAPQADFTVAMARVGSGKGREGNTAFIIDKGTLGYTVEREIKMLDGYRTYEVLLDNCRVADGQTKIHASRLMLQDTTSRVDVGQDIRMEASMLKMHATEMRKK
jgi:alkylation response protein AidB-like acyl-CoA dehydrogenase